MEPINGPQPDHIEGLDDNNFIGFYGAGPKGGQYRCFSNFYMAFMNVDGILYNCMEQYIMAQKALLFNDFAVHRQIMNTRLPSCAKKYGRLVKNYDDNIWNEKRKEIIDKGLLTKFSQNPGCKQVLLSTTGYIAECSPKDRIWGIGYNVHNALENKHNWGQNLLGHGLMRVRDILRHG